MIGFGTIVNGGAVIAGGLFGLILHGGLKQRFHDTMMQAVGIAVIFIGISGAMRGLLTIVENKVETSNTMLMIASLALGALVGEAINLEHHMETFGAWLKRRFGGKDDASFINAFVTASLTICVGAMAIVGPIEDGLTGNASTLYAKAVLDGIILIIFSSTMGRGAIFSVIPLVILQGSVTALAGIIAPVLSDIVIADLSFVGSTLIFCVGINLTFKTKLKVANILPAIIFAALFGGLGIG